MGDGAIVPHYNEELALFRSACGISYHSDVGKFDGEKSRGYLSQKQTLLVDGIVREYWQRTRARLARAWDN